MKRMLFITGLLFIMLPSFQADAGYRDMKKELESYGPPAYLHIGQQPPPAAEATTHDKDFDIEKKRISERADKWKQLATSDPGIDGFFRPDSDLFQSLRATAGDADKIRTRLGEGLSLKVLEILSFLRNPGVKSAEARFRAAIEGFNQVSNLDEILRQYTAFTEALMTGVGPMKGKDSVKMKFPFPGVLSLKGQVVNQTVRSAAEALEATRRDVVTASRKTFWNLLFVQEAQRVTRETLDLLTHLESVATTPYEAGRTSFQDVIKVRIKKATMAEELVTFEEKRKNSILKILELLNLPHGTKLGDLKIPEISDNVPSLTPLYALAHENRQELRSMRAMIGKMERMIEMTETMVLPPYTLNLSLYEDEAVTQAGSSAMKPTFSFSSESSQGAGLPRMPWYGKDDAYLRQTRQELTALKESLIKAEAVTVTKVRNAWFDLDRAMREKILYKDTVLPLSQSALDVSTQGYEAGGVSFADVIGAYSDWLKAGLTFARKQRDVGASWAELARVVGVDMVN